MFRGVESKQQVPKPKRAEEVEDIEIRITEPPPDRSIEFKAVDFNGLTLCFDAEAMEIIHNNDGMVYVSVMGNLIVLYEDPHDLEGVWFAAEHIQHIRTKA